MTSQGSRYISCPLGFSLHTGRRWRFGARPMCLCQASIRCVKCPDHSQMTIQSGYAFLFVCKVQRVTQHSHCKSPAAAPGARQSEDVQVQGHGTHEAKMDGTSRRRGPCVCVQVEGHGTHETKMDGASRRPDPCACVQVQGHGTHEAKLEDGWRFKTA